MKIQMIKIRPPSTPHFLKVVLIVTEDTICIYLFIFVEISQQPLSN